MQDESSDSDEVIELADDSNSMQDGSSDSDEVIEVVPNPPEQAQRAVSEQSYDEDHGADEDRQDFQDRPRGLINPAPDICGDPRCSRPECEGLLHVEVYVYLPGDVCDHFHYISFDDSHPAVGH